MFTSKYLYASDLSTERGGTCVKTCFENHFQKMIFHYVKIKARTDAITILNEIVEEKSRQRYLLKRPLQAVNGAMCHRSAIVNDEARLDIRARGFYREGKNAYFDMRATYADNASQSSKTIKSRLNIHA